MVYPRFLAALALLTACALPAQELQVQAQEIPKELQDVGITEHLGEYVSASQLTFKDETGQPVKLSSFLHREHPVLLTMAYYGCPSLCTFTLNGIVNSLKRLEWTPGNQFDVVIVSIHPKEGPALASAKKASYLKSYGKPETASGWHFLTGEETQIRQLAKEVGFGYKYDTQQQEYAHSAALFVLTPEGKISRYLYGIEYPPKDVRLALLEASSGKIGTVIDRLLLFCYRYDPQTRKYSVYLTRLMQTAAGLTVLLLGDTCFSSGGGNADMNSHLDVGRVRVSRNTGFGTRLRRLIGDRARALVVAGLRRIVGISAAVIVLANTALAESHLPIAATAVAEKWDQLYLFLIWLSVFFFVLVVGAMVYFVIKYRAGSVHKTRYITGNHALEAVWIAVPTVLLMVIFGWGYWVYREMIQAPSDAYEIRVVGKQWAWTFLYDQHDPTTGTLYVPLNRPVKLIMTSEDVLHSFFIPTFRVKQDVVPGMFTSVWFEARVPGAHQVFCAEYCGTSHSAMLAKVIVLTDSQWKSFTEGETPDPKTFPRAGTLALADYEEQVRVSQASAVHVNAIHPVSLAERGKKTFETKGCIACHNPDLDTKIGPNPKGLYMSMVELRDGTKVRADENYIRESIEKPQARLVKGYNPVMPTFQGLINEQEMAEVIAYIKSLSKAGSSSSRETLGGGQRVKTGS